MTLWQIFMFFLCNNQTQSLTNETLFQQHTLGHKVEVNWKHKYLLMFSVTADLICGFQLSIKGDNTEDQRSGSLFVVQLSFQDVALVGATHLHGCGLKTPIWWLYCLGHSSVSSHTCGLGKRFRQPVNWAFMVWEASPGLKVVLVESVTVALVSQADNGSSGAAVVKGFGG